MMMLCALLPALAAIIAVHTHTTAAQPCSTSCDSFLCLIDFFTDFTALSSLLPSPSNRLI